MFMHYDPDSVDVYDALAGKYKDGNVDRESVLYDDYDKAVNLQSQAVDEAQLRFKKAKRVPGKQAERMGH